VLAAEGDTLSPNRGQVASYRLLQYQGCEWRCHAGVVIKLIAKEKGLKFNLSADDVRIALTR
jgi:hypothetical protein